MENILSNGDRIAQNAQNGYILVEALPSGLEIYKKENEAGGWTYYGESCGIFSVIWDTCSGTKEELKAIARHEYGLWYEED